MAWDDTLGDPAFPYSAGPTSGKVVPHRIYRGPGGALGPYPYILEPRASLVRRWAPAYKGAAGPSSSTWIELSDRAPHAGRLHAPGARPRLVAVLDVQPDGTGGMRALVRYRPPTAPRHRARSPVWTRNPAGPEHGALLFLRELASGRAKITLSRQGMEIRRAP